MIWAEIIVYSAGIYLGSGVLFALYFVSYGVSRLDESAKGTSIGFRFLIFFGATAFWVLLAWRLLKGEKRPMERNAHRQSSESRLQAALFDNEKRRLKANRVKLTPFA